MVPEKQVNIIKKAEICHVNILQDDSTTTSVLKKIN